jgi:hypothetical protein
VWKEIGMRVIVGRALRDLAKFGQWLTEPDAYR